MYYNLVLADARTIERVEYVKLRASREIIGIEGGANVGAEITTAACNKNSQDFESVSPAIAGG